jgi:hypothetical protein
MTVNARRSQKRLAALLLSPAGRPELFGSTILAVIAQLRNWPVGHTAIVVGTVFMLNPYLFGNLPALYGSWGLRPLAAE